MNRRVNVEPSVGIEPSRRDPYLLEPTSAGNRWVTHRVQKRLKSRSRVFGHLRGELSDDKQKVQTHIRKVHLRTKRKAELDGYKAAGPWVE